MPQRAALRAIEIVLVLFVLAWLARLIVVDRSPGGPEKRSESHPCADDDCRRVRAPSAANQCT
jgi:hypothetical protein